MFSYWFLYLMIATSVFISLAASLPESSTPGVFKLDIHSNEGAYAHDLVRRDDYELGLNFTSLFYTVNITLGTPPHEKTFKIDTSSSDVYVNGDNNPYSSYFDYIHSSSFRRMFPSFPFKNEFSDDTVAKGFWGAEKFSMFNNTKTFPAQFGVAVEGNGTNTLGLGPVGDEAMVFAMSPAGSYYPTYPNLLEVLKQQKIIGRKAFSLWLEGAFHNNDGLLFGGIDYTKYTKDMFVVPMRDRHSIRFGNAPRKLAVQLDNIQLISRSSFGVSEVSAPVVLDSGNPISRLPSTVVDELVTMLDAAKADELDLYIIDCNASGTLTFTFSGASLTLNVTEFIAPWKNNHFPPGTCVLPISVAKDDEYSLGNTFLRSVYAVFDLESQEVGLAKALKASEAIYFSSIDQLSTGIPRATRAPNY